MFQGVAVDGSSSCIPGQQAYDVEGYDAGGVSGAAARKEVMQMCLQTVQ